MTSLASATNVATLLYQDTMGDAFAQIISEFDAANEAHPHIISPQPRAHADFAEYRLHDAHLVVALAHRARKEDETAPTSALVIALVPAPSARSPHSMQAHHEVLQRIVARIEHAFMPDKQLWSHLDGNLAYADLDGLMTQIWENSMLIPKKTPCKHAPPRWGDAGRQRPAFPPVEALARALDKTALQGPAAPTPVAPAHSLPHPMRREAARLRSALYPDATGAPPSPTAIPLTTRVITYALNTALIILVMPLGLALLTYNALGRESFSLTARTVALSGFGFAISKTTGLGNMLLALV